MTDGNDGHKLSDEDLERKWVEDYEKHALRSRREGYVYLVLILALLAGTVGFWLIADIISTKDVRKSREAAKAPIQSKPISFQDITSCGGRAIAVGHQSVFQVSTDDGMSWEDASGGEQRNFNAVTLSGDCEVAIAVGDGGVIRVSTDGGDDWDTRKSDTENRFNDVALSSDGKTAIAVGERGLFRFSDDGGETWESLDNGAIQDVSGVALSGDGDTAVAVGGNNLWVFTRQNGKWEDKDSADGQGNNLPTNCGGNGRYYRFEAVTLGRDGKSAVVVGDSAILFSDDVTADKVVWIDKLCKETDAPWHHSFKDVAFGGEGDNATVVAVGEDGTIWRSIKGGKTWIYLEDVKRQKNTLEAVALSDDGKVAVAVGQDGTVLVSKDRGENWAFRERKTGNRLHGIALGIEGKVAMIVGHESDILRSEYADGPVFPKMEIVPVAGDTRERPALPTGEVPESRDLVGLFQSNALRVGITVLFMFMAQHLFGLLRYKFRLAAFLDARRNAVLLASMNMFPLPADAEELKQFMDSLSPDTLEIGRPSKTIMDRMMYMMDRFLPEGRRRGGNYACKAGKCTCKPGAGDPG